MVTDLKNPALCARLMADDRPPEVAQFTCLETATENRKSLVLFRKAGSYQSLKFACFANSKQSRNLQLAKTGMEEK